MIVFDDVEHCGHTHNVLFPARVHYGLLVFPAFTTTLFCTNLVRQYSRLRTKSFTLLAHGQIDVLYLKLRAFTGIEPS
jgi:hypothetical protein